MIGTKIRINGVVQGVGFRPFLYREVTKRQLNGRVRNTADGALLILEGESAMVDELLLALHKEAPALARIESVEREDYTQLSGYTDFQILDSKEGAHNTLISSDVCTCPDCLAELFDPKDRRYRFPFINCTNCGPRFTITRDIPYDRANTTMAPFPMCEKCDAEYGDVHDRRYHAQPDCCSVCGPALVCIDEEMAARLKEDPQAEEVSLKTQLRAIADDQARSGADPIRMAQDVLREGGIVAIKGLGGYHLACRADDEAAVERLRARKMRDEKPFALMCADLDAAHALCRIDAEEEKLLASPMRPIVLLKKRDVASHKSLSENERIGIMLPYTPVHFLLLNDDLRCLVMTSANLHDLPIIYRDEEALSALSGIADAFLMHDREIHVACDDSVMWAREGGYFVRRSRGFAPLPLLLPPAKTEILACGAEQKAGFAFYKDSHLFQSQHIGDLKNYETYERFAEQIDHFARLFDCHPQVLACDLHPDYLSTSYALERAKREGLPLVKVQHHHAHMVSCMADNQLDGPVLGLIWDGTGLGTDGTIWGAELLFGDAKEFQRMASIRRICLPGGDLATKEIRRVACALLHEQREESGALTQAARAWVDAIDGSTASDQAATADGKKALEAILRQCESGVNTPQASSMGRLFDGVAALAGIKREASYEGQGAVLLEAAADECETGQYPIAFYEENGLQVFDWRPMIAAILAELSEAGRACASGTQDAAGTGHQARIAARFMNTLVEMAAQQCEAAAKKTGIRDVVLSGGSFQNLYILERLVPRLQAAGLSPHTHHRIATNDEGIATGQAVIAAARF